jgi:serine/threonine protein kinase
VAGSEKVFSPHFRIARSQIGSITHLRLIGVLDDAFEPEAVLQEAVGYVIIDGGRVETVTSTGVRKWQQLVARLPPGTLGMHVIHATTALVDQLNLVEGFAGVASVLSVLAPVTCANCGARGVRPIELDKGSAALAAGALPPMSCISCGATMQLEDDPQEFFAFVKGLKPQRVDRSVERYLASLSRPAKGGKHAESGDTSSWKMVAGNVTYFRLPANVTASVNVRRFGSGVEGRAVYDLGGIGSIGADGVVRLLEIFREAAQMAAVLLWRVPLSVLRVLAKAKATPPVTLSTLAVPQWCTRCDSHTDARIEAEEYGVALKTKTPIERECPICGGAAQVELALDLAPYFNRIKVTGGSPEIEQLDQQVQGQYLSATTISGENEMAPDVPVLASAGLTLIKRIGRGGMAEVFLAKQTRAKGFEKYVVVKKVLAELAQTPEFVEMLFAEARANARLTHPNIVQTFDVGMDGGTAFLVMEYVRGPDVRRVLRLLKRERIELPIEHALRIVADTAAGLQYAHAYVDPGGVPHPMVHRDVTPHNILISLDGAIKLSDFGIAKADDSDSTQAGVLKGKVPYMSPEAIAGRPLDVRHDVFALGVTTYELLTGEMPFGREAQTALRAIVNDAPRPPHELNREIPRALSAVVLRALEKDPQKRIQTAHDFGRQVEMFMAEHGLISNAAGVVQFLIESLGPALAEYDAHGTSGALAPPPVISVKQSGSLGRGPRIVGASSSSSSSSSLQRVADGEPPARATPPPFPRPSIGAHPSARAAARPWMVAVLATVLTALTAGTIIAVVLLSLRGTSAVQGVSNLRADERFYVGGLRTESKAEVTQSSTIVAVAREGRLTRFGTARKGAPIDASALIDASTLPETPEPAVLTVKGAQAPCTVTLSDQKHGPSANLEVSVPAGRELGVVAQCGDRPEMTFEILAVPGQVIELPVK